MFASSLKLSHPKLPLYNNRLKHTVDLSVIKAVAHFKNPSQNPLPADPKALERVFYNALRAVPKRKQDDTIARFQNLMNASQRTSVYGDLGQQVNFASPVSVAQQVQALPLPANMRFNEADVANLTKQLEAPLQQVGQHAAQVIGQAAAKRPPRQQAAPRQAVLASSMEFAVISATCVKTNDILKDEINLSVSTVDGFGAPLTAGPFFVGKFKKGDTVNLGATGQLFDFKISGTTFPASFPFSIFMVESDWIQNADLALQLGLVLFVTGGTLIAVGTTLAALGLAGVVTAPAVPIFLALAVTGLVIGETGRSVLPWLADDISNVVSDALILGNEPEPEQVFDRTLTVDGFFKRGEYRVVLRWKARA